MGMCHQSNACMGYHARKEFVHSLLKSIIAASSFLQNPPHTHTHARAHARTHARTCAHTHIHRYNMIRAPMCDYLMHFVHKLRELNSPEMMNRVLENFSASMVSRCASTYETKLFQKSLKLFRLHGKPVYSQWIEKKLSIFLKSRTFRPPWYAVHPHTKLSIFLQSLELLGKIGIL